MDNNMSIGWGRPRPKYSELEPSDVENFNNIVIDDDDAHDDGAMFGDDVQARPRIDNDMHLVTRVAQPIDYPLKGYDGAPCGELSQLYVNQGYEFKGLKEYYYTLVSDMKSPNTRFFSIFTCPVTGEHFSSGILPNTEVDFLTEMPWYKTKKLAVTAAAAKALDCFSLRRCYGTEKTHWQRCIDSPYLSAEEAPALPELPPGVVLSVPSIVSQAEQGKHDDDVHPKQALIQHYVSFVKSLEMRGICTDYPANEMGPKSDSYSCWPNMKDSPNTMWTAIFTCHLTGEKFPSGSLHGREGAYENNSWYYDSSRCMINPRENIDDFHESNFDRVDFIWYRTKKEAINAAAGRALDCLRHRDSSCCTYSSDRYCRESPYTVHEPPVIWKRVCQSARGVCGIDWPSLPHEDRLTTQLGISNLHCLLEDKYDDEYWRTRYKERRFAVGKEI
jgi:hypothetical protein